MNGFSGWAYQDGWAFLAGWVVLSWWVWSELMAGDQTAYAVFLIDFLDVGRPFQASVEVLEACFAVL